MLFTYIHINIPVLNEGSLRQILPLLVRPSPSPKLATLISSIEDRLYNLEHQHADTVSGSKALPLNNRSSIWEKELYKRILYFFPGDIAVAVHSGNAGADWRTSVIQDVVKRFVESVDISFLCTMPDVGTFQITVSARRRAL